MSLGYLMLDIAGTELSLTDERRLLHPACAGVILFTRNYQNRLQLKALTKVIRSLRPELLIAVDHEGGRVQRFRDGFTKIPPMATFGEIAQNDLKLAQKKIFDVGYQIATELIECGIDFSFTPVLDLNYGRSQVIGDRALSANPEIVLNLAYQLMLGLRKGGMISVGKHFPGHGYVTQDSHFEIPLDTRSFSDILKNDLVPFRGLIQLGLPAIMPAHVIYTQIDSFPPGFSSFWLQKILRHQLNFNGAIISDDLSMEGAYSVGNNIQERAYNALKAGCDLLLICNHPELVDALLYDHEKMLEVVDKKSEVRLQKLQVKW